jgi:predicted PurR-regulated permease PerM
MFVLLGGGAAFGILGVLMAIPLTAVLCAVLIDQKT